MPNDSRIEPETLERGRYRVLATPDGGIVIVRAIALCDRCYACTCGDQAEPIGPVPGGILKMMQSIGAGNGGRLPSPKEMMAAISALRAGRG
jgi:hypothetical protein